MKIKLLSREGQIFPGGRGSYFDIFPGKCEISKITVINCYLAVNCPKPPQPHFGTFLEGVDHCSSRGSNPLPPSIFTLLHCITLHYITLSLFLVHLSNSLPDISSTHSLITLHYITLSLFLVHLSNSLPDISLTHSLSLSSPIQTARCASYRIKGKIYKACVQSVLTYMGLKPGRWKKQICKVWRGRNGWWWDGCTGCRWRIGSAVWICTVFWGFRAWLRWWGMVDWGGLGMWNVTVEMIGCQPVEMWWWQGWDVRVGAGRLRENV